MKKGNFLYGFIVVPLSAPLKCIFLHSEGGKNETFFPEKCRISDQNQGEIAIFANNFHRFAYPARRMGF
jgi:hypothetical protein